MPTEAFGVGQYSLRGLLKTDKDARFLAALDAMYQELHREYGLTGTWPAQQERCAATGQASASDLIETGDSSRRFV
jgi:hypothetical protein